MTAMFKEGHWLAGGLLIVLLAGVLIGILYHAMRMLCDKAKREPLGDLLGKIDVPVLAILLLLTCIIGAGFENIPWVSRMLDYAVMIVGG